MLLHVHNLKLPTLSWLSRDRSRTLSATDCLTRWPVAAHAHSTISWRFVTRPLYLTQLFLFLVWLSYVLISQQATIRNGHRLLLTSTCTISHPLVLVHHMTLPLSLAFKLAPSNQLETTPFHYRTSFHYIFLPSKTTQWHINSVKYMTSPPVAYMWQLSLKVLISRLE